MAPDDFHITIIYTTFYVRGCLKSSWTRLITLSWNLVEVWWQFLFWSTSLRKWCTSYNAPCTSQKCASYCWSLRNLLP